METPFTTLAKKDLYNLNPCLNKNLPQVNNSLFGENN